MIQLTLEFRIRPVFTVDFNVFWLHLHMIPEAFQQIRSTDVLRGLPLFVGVGKLKPL
jgi:hypothetical protein